jgi:hypothetical protein
MKPPPEPAQVHDHGPEPVTDDWVPALQRFVVGADENVPPFDEPQEPDVPQDCVFVPALYPSDAHVVGFPPVASVQVPD